MPHISKNGSRCIIRLTDLPEIMWCHGIVQFLLYMWVLKQSNICVGFVFISNVELCCYLNIEVDIWVHICFDCFKYRILIPKLKLLSIMYAKYKIYCSMGIKIYVRNFFKCALPPNLKSWIRPYTK